MRRGWSLGECFALVALCGAVLQTERCVRVVPCSDAAKVCPRVRFVLLTNKFRNPHEKPAPVNISVVLIILVFVLILTQRLGAA